MSKKQQLLLYLIANHTFLQWIGQLIKVFDRANFPSEISSSLELLENNGLIEIDKLYENKTAVSYRATKKGMQFLNDEVNTESLIQYVKTFEYPDQLLMALNV